MPFIIIIGFVGLLLILLSFVTVKQGTVAVSCSDLFRNQGALPPQSATSPRQFNPFSGFRHPTI